MSLDSDFDDLLGKSCSPDGADSDDSRITVESTPAAPRSAPPDGGAASPQGLPAEITEGALAALLGIGASRVKTLARNGILVRASRGRFDFSQSLRNYLAQLREHAARAGRPSTGGDALKEERLRLTKAQADAQETKNALARGELVPVADTLREWQAVLRDIRAVMLAVPSQYASTQPHLSVHDIAALTDDIKRALEGLADGNA